MWQIIAVVIIGIVTLAYVLSRIYKLVKHRKDGSMSCPGCSCCNPDNHCNEGWKQTKEK